jgi:hypothetical protein
MPMGTVLGGPAAYPPLPPPQAPLPPPAPPATPPPAAEPGAGDAERFEEWARERPSAHGHQLGPVVDQRGGLPDLGATPSQPAEDDWTARFGALAEQFDEPGAREPEPRPPAEQSWPSGPGPRPDDAAADTPPPPTWLRPDRPPQEPEPFGGPYGREPAPAAPEAGQPSGGAGTARAAARQAGTRSRGRPEDPRQAAVYDALTINEQVLDEVWTSPSVDVLKVVSSIVVNALDAYEDDPAEYADWVAVHRTGNCDCH